jgi:hypothetical protein
MRRYIFPDVIDDLLRGRGSLSQRMTLAAQAGCEFFEMPGGIVRDAAESALTGLEPGACLDEAAAARLYADSDTDVTRVPYILQTDPALPGGSEGASGGDPMFDWADLKWVSQFAESLLIVARRLGSAPSVVEIQGGRRTGGVAQVLLAARVIRERLEKNLGVAPRVWVGNRAGQLLQCGGEMAEFWEAVRMTRGAAAWLGVCLHIDELWAAGRANFPAELDGIPEGAVRALRVQAGLGAPALQEIPWDLVFSRRYAQSGGCPITPAVARRAEVEPAIRFCEGWVARAQGGVEGDDPAPA